MEPKSKFKNVSGGVAGAIQLNHEGKAAGVPVFPNESIWLTEQEQVLTANAPRNESDNPFVNGTFQLEIKAEDAAYARPIGDTQQADPPPAPPEGEPEPPPSEGDPEGIDLRQESGAANEPPPQETGAPPAPEGDPVAGQRQPDEEAAAAPVAPPEHEPQVEERTIVDPGADEGLEPEPPRKPAVPEPKPGQSKRAARAVAQPPPAKPAPATPQG
jgi:hypothetical protein